MLRDILKEVYKYFPEEKTVCTELVCDDDTAHYEIMQVGWSHGQRVHGVVIPINVRPDRIYVEHNRADIDVVEMTQKTGVPDNDLVVGWHPPHIRQYTEFALA